ncbi:hypothetical protein [Parabacteroides chongii]|uniref:hypothetical protein n=2 Tax=Parabacteroides chongii TaxID=2685834 RepID=UPI00240D7975|nr:hypothetical protein [Parabacteroides chongii]WFE85058.1 hypothetical protein P3L47_00150 [Parabacteroides chongii]
MKEKIFNLLKQSYSNFGLSDDILQGQAEALANTGLVTEDNLQTVVDGQKSFLSSLQSGIDKRVTDAVNKAKGEKREEPAGGGEQKKNEPDLQKMIEEALAAKLSPIQEELNAYKTKEQQTARANMIASKAKELGIPEWRAKEGFAITPEMDEAAINSYLAGIKQNIVTAGLESSNASGVLSTSDDKAKEEADQWAKNLPDAN